MCLKQRAEDCYHDCHAAGLGDDNETKQIGDDAQAGDEYPGTAHDGCEDRSENAGEPGAHAEGCHKACNGENAADEDGDGPHALCADLGRSDQTTCDECNVCENCDHACVDLVGGLSKPEDKCCENNDDALLFLGAELAESLVRVLDELNVCCLLSIGGLAENEAEHIDKNYADYIPYACADKPLTPGNALADEAEHKCDINRAGNESHAELVGAHEVCKPQAERLLGVALCAGRLTYLVDKRSHHGSLCGGGRNNGAHDNAGKKHCSYLTCIGSGEAGQHPQRQALHKAAVVDAYRHDEHADAEPYGAGCKV